MAGFDSVGFVMVVNGNSCPSNPLCNFSAEDLGSSFYVKVRSSRDFVFPLTSSFARSQEAFTKRPFQVEGDSPSGIPVEMYG